MNFLKRLLFGNMNDDWKCSCGELNYRYRGKCRKCNKQALVGGVNIKKGDWVCNCGVINFSSRTQCYKCNKNKGDQSKTETTSFLPRSGDWYCNKCNDLNFSNRTSCRKCSNPKTEAKVVITNKDDWTCPNTGCKELNFAFRDICYKCNTLKIKASTNNIDNKEGGKDNTKGDEDDDDKYCIVCMEREKNMAIIKCGHLCLCSICGYALDQCPLCREPFNPDEHLIKIFQ